MEQVDRSTSIEAGSGPVSHSETLAVTAHELLQPLTAVQGCVGAPRKCSQVPDARDDDPPSSAEKPR